VRTFLLNVVEALDHRTKPVADIRQFFRFLGAQGKVARRTLRTNLVNENADQEDERGRVNCDRQQDEAENRQHEKNNADIAAAVLTPPVSH
jgi:hypothetical protein